MIAELNISRPEYTNDVCDIMRLFFPKAEIKAAKYPTSGVPFLKISVIDKSDANNIAFANYISASNIAREYSREFAPESNKIKNKRLEKRAVKIAAFRAMLEIEADDNIPWGSLTGIRPTRLFRELAEENGVKHARDMFIREFDVAKDKVALCDSIVTAQQPFISDAGEKDIDIYVHIPYCKTRCIYCSFPSIELKGGEVSEEYLLALRRDIEFGADWINSNGYNVRCLYIGGGTPTALNTAQLEGLLTHIQRCYGGKWREFTLEAGRPDTLDVSKLRVLKDAGVTRISLNPQSMNNDTLKIIGRMHTAEELTKTYYEARKLGFDNINMDIIAGLPGEFIGDFVYTLERIKSLNPDSLTVHTLALKRSSLLKERLEDYPLVGPDITAQMVSIGEIYAKALGMSPYYMYRQKYVSGNLENVGYSQPNKICIYNIDMMEENVSIMAHGAGAMSKRVFRERDLRIERIPSPKDIQTYLNKLDYLNNEKASLFRDDGQPGKNV